MKVYGETKMAATQALGKNRQGTSKAHAQLESHAVNPALAPIQVLIGEWDMEMSNTSFLPNPSDTARGHVTFEWVQGGAFLMMRMGGKPADSQHALWLVGRDESSADYKVFYYDTRRVSRIYEMSWTAGVWKMWRQAPGFWQRFEGKFSKDLNRINAYWEKSTDGSDWEHDFDQTFTRVM
jgi:hypothetical protein